MVNTDYIKQIKKLDNGLGESHTDGNHIIPISRRYMNKSPPPPPRLLDGFQADWRKHTNLNPVNAE